MRNHLRTMDVDFPSMQWRVQHDFRHRPLQSKDLQRYSHANEGVDFAHHE